jgi:hypothetical protein
LFRLGVLVAALWAVRAAPVGGGRDAGDLLEKVSVVWPEVRAVGEEREGMFELLGKDGVGVGWVATTFPEAEGIQGYVGPSELWVAFDLDRRVRHVGLVASEDTAGHLRMVEGDAGFWRQWVGRGEMALGISDGPVVVSGATLTSEAMARGVAARFGAEGMESWFSARLGVEAVARWFPGMEVVLEDEGRGIYQVMSGGKRVGRVLRSSGMGVCARGFQGVSDVVVVMDADGEVVSGVGLLDSRDNEPYWGDVVEELKYADGFVGKRVEEILAEEDASGFLLVSGASMTAGAVIESVREMLRRDRMAEAEGGVDWEVGVALAWVAAGCFFGLRGKGGKRGRWGFAVVSVAAGLWFGWMLGQDQVLGWARHGLDWRAVLPLLAMTGVALVVPAMTGKNVYCSRICPHGAAQVLAGSLMKRRFALRGRWHRVMERVPWVALLAIWALALLGSGLPLSDAEPFEVWSVGFQAWLPAAILTVGLVAAVFLPQGYCHYGCPTGALLKFLTHSPGRLTKRDLVAVGLVVLAWGFVFFG